MRIILYTEFKLSSGKLNSIVVEGKHFFTSPSYPSARDLIRKWYG